MSDNDITFDDMLNIKRERSGLVFIIFIIPAIISIIFIPLMFGVNWWVGLIVTILLGIVAFLFIMFKGCPLMMDENFKKIKK